MKFSYASANGEFSSLCYLVKTADFPDYDKSNFCEFKTIPLLDLKLVLQTMQILEMVRTV